MRNYYHDENHDQFGWLKTLGLIVAVFALMITSGMMAAKAADSPCAQACRARDDQCRVQTKNSPSCVGQLNGCMHSCMTPSAKEPATAHLPAAPKKN